MKEQVSIDFKLLTEGILDRDNLLTSAALIMLEKLKSEYELLTIISENHDRLLTALGSNRKEQERLRRLDDNVKKLLEDVRYDANNKELYVVGAVASQYIHLILSKLESLDK